MTLFRRVFEDNPPMGKEGIEKCNGENFHTLQIKLRGYLMKKNLWHITKSSPTDARGNNAQMQKDEQALGVIITSLHDNYIHFINECEHAPDAWEILEKNVGAKAKQIKIGLKKQY